ncbi:MAG: bacteriohemerythrin [Solidesulfovibrio sp.]|uniref:bacteriohemerythrin n=1 Tax=Solidesulfovibrio sp. TaxID=2910990 RepID=UPI002B21616E|nr:bacteriohemerythrin [Solidesulfovibrio sp.]MEA4858669.1 bacteriohemerythrin [Solidesulfovibrio sp.]
MISWDSCLSVGVTEIDEQHQAIIGLINDLEAKQDSDDPAVVTAALRFLRDYLERHFALEEKLMADIAYPHREHHLATHEQFVNHVIFFEIEKEFGLVTRQMVEDLLGFLMEWFVRHIASEDRALGAYLRAGPASCYES